MSIHHQINGAVQFTEPWRDATQAGDANSLAHLRNASIERMGLRTGAERCVPLLSGVSDALNFKVGRLCYGDNLQETETLQRSVDWIMRDLRVTEYELTLSDQDGDNSERALLPSTLTHDSVRATAEYLYVQVGQQRTPARFQLPLPAQLAQEERACLHCEFSMFLTIRM